MSAFVAAARLEDLPPGSARTVRVGQTPIALFNDGGAIYAVHDTCLHRESSLAAGTFAGGVATCPLHAWRYDLATGKCLMRPGAFLARFAVRVEEGAILVDPEPLPRAAGPDRPPGGLTSALTTVLLPGLHGNAALLSHLLRALPPSLEPRALSYPASGEPDHDALVAHLERELPRDRPYALVAESFGGPLALRLAARAANRPRAVVLVATYLRRPLGRLSRWMSPLARPFLMGIPPPAALARRLLLGADAPPALVAEFLACVRRVPPATMAARVRVALTSDARRDFQRCPVPLLCIDAGREGMLSRSASAELHALRSDVEWAVIDSPHMILQLRPAEAGERIARFLRQHQPPAVGEAA